jgi:hypothetical protein
MGKESEDPTQLVDWQEGDPPPEIGKCLAGLTIIAILTVVTLFSVFLFPGSLETFRVILAMI